MKKENWVWMPHVGHFIMGHECRFRLNTYVGGYVVSTVGELPHHHKEGFENVNFDSKYETMVFKAEKRDDECCPYEAIVSDNVDIDTYNEAGAATKGHMKLCKKWSRRN